LVRLGHKKALEPWCHPYLRVANNIEESDHIGSASQVLKNLNLTLDLLFLDGLQDLDAALFIVDSVEAFKNLRVLSSSNLANNLIVVLDTTMYYTCGKNNVGESQAIHSIFFSTTENMKGERGWEIGVVAIVVLMIRKCTSERERSGFTICH
jgi:hypothetical protein